MNQKKRNRGKQLNIRLNDSEIAYIKEKADYSGKNLSEFCRQTLINGLVLKTNTELVKEVLVQLTRIGTNINQIAKAINLYKSEVTIEDYNKIREQVEEMQYFIIEKVYHATYELSARLKENEEEFSNLYIEDLDDFEFDTVYDDKFGDMGDD